MSVKLYNDEEEEDEIEEEGKQKRFKSLSNLRIYRNRYTWQQDVKKQKYSIKKTQPKTRRYKRKKKSVKRCN